MNPENLVKTVVQFGNASYTIKSHWTCKNQLYYALECERSLPGYNGECPQCGESHVRLAYGRGYYLKAEDLYKVLDRQKLKDQRSKGRIATDDLPSISEKLAPLDHPILGQNKGIEGDSNSCYMDSTIFCMFAYSNVFDSLLHVKVDKTSIKELQNLLRENIVHVLRSDNGFVERKFSPKFVSFLIRNFDE